MKFSKYFDHTLLKPDATQAQITALCEEAVIYDFYSVCVNSSNVKQAAENLKDTDIKVASVVGFPLGAMSTAAKVYETCDAIENGASEIDMVINIGAAKEGRFDFITQEIATIATICHEKNAVLKVIIETCLLSDDEKKEASLCCIKGCADFVKTSTGFSTGGATLQDVKLIKSIVNNNAKIKASGGIKTLEDAKKFVNIGVQRLGCSSGVEIMKEYLNEL